MGFLFSRKAENDMELDTAELKQILLRDHTILTMEEFAGQSLKISAIPY